MRRAGEDDICASAADVPTYFASLGFSAAPVWCEVGAHYARVACMEARRVNAFRNLRDGLRATMQCDMIGLGVCDSRPTKLVTRGADVRPRAARIEA
jgi:hypothetical protein